MTRTRKGQARRGVHLMITALGPGQDMTLFQLCRREDGQRETDFPKGPNGSQAVLLSLRFPIPFCLVRTLTQHLCICVGLEWNPAPSRPSFGWLPQLQDPGHTSQRQQQKAGVHENHVTQCGALGVWENSAPRWLERRTKKAVEKSGLFSQSLHMGHLCSLRTAPQTAPYSRAGSNQVQGVAS